ncbi:MAG: GIY-YIG nuclease family protein [Patescibacteria group bacterium]|jgi:putative endonuclease
MSGIYVLKSLKNGKRYVGSTRKDVDLRLKEHNYGSNVWTRQNGPFKLIYKEGFTDYKDALKRERFLKSGQGRKFLDSILGG